MREIVRRPRRAARRPAGWWRSLISRPPTEWGAPTQVYAKFTCFLRTSGKPGGSGVRHGNGGSGVRHGNEGDAAAGPQATQARLPAERGFVQLRAQADRSGDSSSAVSSISTPVQRSSRFHGEADDRAQAIRVVSRRSHPPRGKKGRDSMNAIRDDASTTSGRKPPRDRGREPGMLRGRNAACEITAIGCGGAKAPPLEVRS
jgi:hypothetical protein